MTDDRSLPASFADTARAYARGELQVTEPRAAATVVLLRDPPRARRAPSPDRRPTCCVGWPRWPSRPGMFVFPGGSVDPRDEELPDSAWVGPPASGMGRPAELRRTARAIAGVRRGARDLRGVRRSAGRARAPTTWFSTPAVMTGRPTGWRCSTGRCRWRSCCGDGVWCCAPICCGPGRTGSRRSSSHGGTTPGSSSRPCLPASAPATSAASPTGSRGFGRPTPCTRTPAASWRCSRPPSSPSPSWRRTARSTQCSRRAPSVTFARCLPKIVLGDDAEVRLLLPHDDGYPPDQP